MTTSRDMSESTPTNDHLIKVGNLLANIGLTYEIDETHTSLCTGITIEDDPIPIIVTPAADYWLLLQTWKVCRNPLIDDIALVKLYKALLRENDFTKLGKFSLDANSHLIFSVDLRLEDLNESLLEEAINLIGFVVSERLPEIAEPYVEYLFQNQ